MAVNVIRFTRIWNELGEIVEREPDRFVLEFAPNTHLTGEKAPLLKELLDAYVPMGKGIGQKYHLTVNYCNVLSQDSSILPLWEAAHKRMKELGNDLKIENVAGADIHNQFSQVGKIEDYGIPPLHRAHFEYLSRAATRIMER